MGEGQCLSLLSEQAFKTYCIKCNKTITNAIIQYINNKAEMQMTMKVC